MLIAFVFTAITGFSFIFDAYLRPPDFWDQFAIRVTTLADFEKTRGTMPFSNMKPESIVLEILSGQPGKFSVSITCPGHEQTFTIPPIEFISDAAADKVFMHYIAVEKPPADSLDVTVIHEEETHLFIFPNITAPLTPITGEEPPCDTLSSSPPSSASPSSSPTAPVPPLNLIQAMGRERQRAR